MTSSRVIGLAIVALVSATSASVVCSQIFSVHKSTLQEQPFPAPAYHTVMVRTVVDRGGEVPAHIHPGVEIAYVLEGQAAVTIQGRPPLLLGKGDTFSVPARTVHSVRNAGSGALTMVSTYVVELGQPIASPAP